MTMCLSGLVQLSVWQFAALASAWAQNPAAPAANPSALTMLPPVVQGGQLGAGWRVATVPQQRAPVTRFSAETVDGRLALRVDAHAAYGNLVFETGTTALPSRLSWAWRVQQGNSAADLSTKAGDDVPAKVCLSFDLPLAQVPFVERQLLRVARSRTGEHLPAATLCWVWGGSTQRGQLVRNAYSPRVRYIVLRTQDEKLDTWFEESRDVAADFQRAFGDEAAAPPPLLAVVVGGDADNTGAHSIAHVAALRWLP